MNFVENRCTTHQKNADGDGDEMDVADDSHRLNRKLLDKQVVVDEADARAEESSPLVHMALLEIKQ